jgi:hypothetical protein
LFSIPVFVIFDTGAIPAFFPMAFGSLIKLAVMKEASNHACETTSA